MEESSSKQPSEEPSSARKRKRKTYSCFDCRRRKLKCDRDHPCGRCTKEGHPQSCAFRNDGQNSDPENVDGTYRAHPGLETERPSKQVVDNGVGRPAAEKRSFTADENASLRRKIALLEAKIARLECSSQVLDGHLSVPSVPQEKETRFFKGTSFKSQFYGLTNPTSLFTHFPEVATSKEARSKLYRIPQVQQDLFTLRSHRKSRKNQEPLQITTDLISLLPSRDIMQYMIQLYFDTYETAYRVIHKPTFWKEYHARPESRWRPAFAAIVLAILASVSCVAVSELSFRDDFSSARVTATRYVAAVENWLNHQSEKHLTIERFQVNILLLLAKATNALKRKRAWANSGFLLRVAVSAGFHRDPSHMEGTISSFDKEMRCRLWATIFEWDLSVSISRGMPPMATSIPSDCRSPLNINDDAFDQDSQRLPESRPLSDQTDTSFLQLSLASLPLRTSLTTLLNDSNIDISWSEVLTYEERIRQELESLPLWARQKKSFSAVMLDLQLRQFMLWIYAKQARGASGPRTAYARMACVNASTEIVETYLTLGDADVNALNMLRHDMYQCIITISLALLSEAKNASMAWSLTSSLQPVCDKAFLLLEDKVLKVGEGYNHMWWASTSFASAQTALDPKMGESKTIAIERVAKIYYKILAYQEPANLPGTKATPLPNGNGTSTSTSTSTSTNNSSQPSTSWQTTTCTSAGGITTPTSYADLLKNASGETLDLSEIPDWMVDDFFSFDTATI